MCYELSRRNIIIAAIGGIASGLGLEGVQKKLTVDVMADLFERRRTLAQLLNDVPSDKADRNPSYLEGTDMQHWHMDAHPFFQHLASMDLVPKQGLVIELGSYQGKSLAVLNQLFGEGRVLGCDIHRYTANPQILVGDVRNPETLKNFGSAALVWNDVSNWENSPRSKMAAFEWAKSHLIPGGIYVDDAMKNIPVDLDLRGFQLIYAKGYISAFKKT